MIKPERPRLAGNQPSPDTKTAILDAAERLFASQGVHAVSVRAVLAEAGVNVALAHYYFGGRDGLVREVLRRRVEPLNEKRLQLLAEVEAAAGEGRPTVDAVLRAFFAPVIDLLDEHPDVACLLGQIHGDADAKLRKFYRSMFADVLRRFSNALRAALPAALSGPQRASRAHFVFGAMIYTLTNYGDLELMARGRYETPRGETLLGELVAFCSAGLTAPAVDGARPR